MARRNAGTLAFIAAFVFTCIGSGVLSQTTSWLLASPVSVPLAQSYQTWSAPSSSRQSNCISRSSTQPYIITASASTPEPATTQVITPIGTPTVLSFCRSVLSFCRAQGYYFVAASSLTPEPVTSQTAFSLTPEPVTSKTFPALTPEPTPTQAASASAPEPATIQVVTPVVTPEPTATQAAASLTLEPVTNQTASSLTPEPVTSKIVTPAVSAHEAATTQAASSLTPEPVTSKTFPALTPEPTPTPAPQENNMYPYGLQQNDNEFKLNDYIYYWQCPEIRTDSLGFPFFGERHYKLFICTNGKIQLNYGWSWWWPQKFGIYYWFNRMAIISPFWATTDEYVAFKAGHSKMYYHVYRDNDPQASQILLNSSKHVRDYDNSGKFSNFKANWVLVVTWEKICPYVYYHYYYYDYSYNWETPRLKCQWSNTFQAVIITDGFSTFLMYNYPKGGINWVVPVLPYYYRYWTAVYGIPVAGWNAGDNGENYLNMKGSGTLLGMYGLDDKTGNTGVQGRYFWRISNNDAEDARSKCLRWASFQQKTDSLSSYNLNFRQDQRMACPCSVWQAWNDRRFIWDWMSSWPKWCYRSRRSIYLERLTPDQGVVTVKMTQLCCYSTEWPGDWGALKTGPPDGGRVEVEVLNQWSSSVEEVYTDQQAYKYCCVDYPMCSIFYENRPSDNCALYNPPIIRWGSGDPHFRTLDGVNYTFNGLGEYVMIDAQNGSFQLQARTGLAQGNATTATIFTAGAAKEENTSTVEVRVGKGGGIVTLIDRVIYSGYHNLTNRSVETGEKLFISKPKENCLAVSFPSATSVQFCEQKEMLSFVVTPGDDYKNATKGLMGTWNDDPDDDFTLPDGTVLPSSSTSKALHFGFGVKWQINQSQSLFTYAKNENVNTFAKPNFVPMFADNITWYNDSLRKAAEAQCGDDYECLFDAASTSDLSIGMTTKLISVQLVNESKVLGNFPPKIINTPRTINATLHEVVQLNITAEDNDTISFHVIKKPAGANAIQEGNVLHFTWPVTSSQKFNLSFVATDDKGASAVWNPTINMCACNHGGQCVQPEEGDPLSSDSRFVYMGCACQGGYTGRFCDSDIDACEMNGEPCYAGVECIDLPPPANVSGYKCGTCPSGYTGNGAQCAEIDECEKSETNNCEQICVNVPGSFFCDCRDGYKLSANKHNCKDGNECEPTSDCMQKCINTQGSYKCSCDQYFQADPADWRKCIATNPCLSDHDCQHVCFKGKNNQPTCACFANFELESDGKKCKVKNINECDPAKDLNRCNQICQNTLGGYKCSCLNGFELSKNGYDCEDVNECLDEDLYNCMDEFHKCVNTRGSYKCECDQGLYFIDGKCRGLAKNETAPPPVLPNPRQPSSKEREQGVQISIEAASNFEWNYQVDKSFKDKMASFTSTFCTDNRTVCALKESRLYSGALILDLYTADQTHLVPGYPTYTSGSFLVAFYVLQPLGLFLGNTSVLPGSTLLGIVITYKSELETAIGAKISGVELLWTPTETSSTEKPMEEESFNKWKWIAIGVSAGVFVIVLIVVICFWCKKKKRPTIVKPVSDDGTELYLRRIKAEGKERPQKATNN